MKEKVKGALQNKLIVGIAFLIMGIGMIFVPEVYISVIVRIIGILLLVISVIRIIIFAKNEKNSSAVIGMIITIVLIAFGVSFLANPTWIVQFIYIIFGLLIAFEGVMGIVNSIAVLRKNGLPWIPFFIVSVIVIALGVIIVLNPFKTAEWLYRFIGISLAVEGVIEICTFIANRKAAK